MLFYFWGPIVLLFVGVLGKAKGETLLNEELIEVERYSYVSLLSVNESQVSFVGVGTIVSRFWVLSTCTPLLNTTLPKKKIHLADVEMLKVRIGNDQSSWKCVIKTRCLDSYIYSNVLVGNDLGILKVKQKFLWENNVSPFPLNDFMNSAELYMTENPGTHCEVFTGNQSDIFEMVPMMTTSTESCADFISAEIVEVNQTELIQGLQSCLIPMPMDEHTSAKFLPGSPVLCNNKLFGFVSMTKEPALFEVFPLIVTKVHPKIFEQSMSRVWVVSVHFPGTLLSALILNVVLL